MKVLFIHQNFPGQFVHLSAALAKVKRNQVVALTMYQNVNPAGVTVRPYTLLRPSAPETHPMLKDEEAKILRAEACAAAAFQLKREGFVPDVIVAHPGWGEALFMKDVFPQAKLVIYCEYFYALDGQDVGFDPEIPALTFEQKCRLRLKNTTNLLSMESADAAISPTEWQKSTYPTWAQEKITVIHDGIDLEPLKHNPKAALTLPANAERAEVTLRYGDEVLTHVARNLEPVRGIHVFMRALPEILRRRPKAHALIIGGDDVSYGHHAPDGLSWKDHMLNEVGAGLDMRRVHFVGKIPYASYIAALHVSKVHAYWTTPFVLSWSFLEAAASGVPMVASDTAPVREFSAPFGVKLLPFFSAEAFSNTIVETLASRPIRREFPTPGQLDLAHCVKQQIGLIKAL